MRPYERSSAGLTVAPILSLAALALLCHNCLGGTGGEHNTSPAEYTKAEIHPDPEAEMTTNSPRILTVLTTYNKRTPFIKAYREAAADREDGLEPLVSGGVEPELHH